MIFYRTANAGGLLTLDDVTILLDGVCGEEAPYIPTPKEVKESLVGQMPDIAAFTHFHNDHYDEDYVKEYIKRQGKPVLGFNKFDDLAVKNVCVHTVKTRHIGKNNIEHYSYIISGKKRILFTGDASPLDMKNIEENSGFDVIFVPYAYVVTKTAWQISKSMGAEKIVLLHMPPKAFDEYHLWDAVYETVGDDSSLIIPDIKEKIIL